jgi:hypothetical protein
METMSEENNKPEEQGKQSGQEVQVPAAAAPAAEPAKVDDKSQVAKPGEDGKEKAPTSIIGAAGTEPQKKEKPAEGQDPAPGEPKKEEKKDDNPVEYEDFILPEGVKVNKELMSAFKKFASENGLTQEQAQKIVEMQTKDIIAQEKAAQEAHLQRVKTWETESLQFLGPDKDKKLAAVGKVFNKFGAVGGNEVRDILEKTGLGSHPAFVKFFAAVGSNFAEDPLPEGAPGASANEKDAQAIQREHAKGQLDKLNKK